MAQCHFQQKKLRPHHREGAEEKAEGKVTHIDNTCLDNCHVIFFYRYGLVICTQKTPQHRLAAPSPSWPRRLHHGVTALLWAQDRGVWACPQHLEHHDVGEGLVGGTWGDTSSGLEVTQKGH